MRFIPLNNGHLSRSESVLRRKPPGANAELPNRVRVRPNLLVHEEGLISELLVTLQTAARRREHHRTRESDIRRSWWLCILCVQLERVAGFLGKLFFVGACLLWSYRLPGC